MTQTIHTMIGGRSLVFEKDALDIMTEYLRRAEHIENRYAAEKTIADKLSERGVEIVSPADIQTAITEVDNQFNPNQDLLSDRRDYVETPSSNDPVLDTTPEKKTDGAVFLGVCAYFAQRFGISAFRVRLIFVVLFFIGYGISILLYIIGYYVMVNDKSI